MTNPAPIVVVAPYSPVGSCPVPALGAAKKIASVVSALSASGSEVLFVNSAHNSVESCGLKVESLQFRPGLTVKSLTLPTARKRPLGKALNVLCAKLLARKIARDYCGNEASLLWIYNGYAFESRFALEFKKITGCPLVLEMEDMPFSRNRPGSLKPWLDDRYLRRVLPQASLVTCVNSSIQSELALPNGRSMLLPGLVDGFADSEDLRRTPFSRNVHALGYFGGLTREKGAHKLLELFQELPTGWRLVVTGAGPLREDFALAAASSPDRLHFIPDASDAEVAACIDDCDAIINPHSSIADMGNGVFPFKVMEAVASGRLVISTPLPASGIDLNSVILFIDPDLQQLRPALLTAAEVFKSRRVAIREASELVVSRFSEASLADVVRRRFFPAGTGARNFSSVGTSRKKPAA